MGLETFGYISPRRKPVFYWGLILVELLIGAVVVVVAVLLWNGLRPPGATVKSSLERERRRRERAQGGRALKLVLLSTPALAAALWDLEAVAATLIG